MPAVLLPAPVALARLTDSLTPGRRGRLVWEPKWDGYRALAADGRLYSRNGTDLTPFFPDLARSWPRDYRGLVWTANWSPGTPPPAGLTSTRCRHG